MNWQNQHLQNVEDEEFNSFDRTRTQAWRKISGQWEHMSTVGEHIGTVDVETYKDSWDIYTGTMGIYRDSGDLSPVTFLEIN